MINRGVITISLSFVTKFKKLWQKATFYNEVTESLQETAHKIDAELKKYRNQIVQGNIDFKIKFIFI